MTESEAVLDSSEAIRDHLQFCMMPEDFGTDGVRFVLCDEFNVVRAHCHVGQMPPEPDVDECTRVISVFAHSLVHMPGNGAMLVALTRTGPPTFRAADRQWFRVAHEVCAAHDVRLLGVHVVTPRGQREIVLDDAL